MNPFADVPDAFFFPAQVTVGGGAYPSPLNYCHFPKSCCTSVNEVRDCLIFDATVGTDRADGKTRFGAFLTLPTAGQVICHGIPDQRKLEDGDIVNLDISVFLNGYHGAPRTLPMMQPPVSADYQQAELLTTSSCCTALQPT